MTDEIQARIEFVKFCKNNPNTIASLYDQNGVFYIKIWNDVAYINSTVLDTIRAETQIVKNREIVLADQRERNNRLLELLE